MILNMQLKMNCLKKENDYVIYKIHYMPEQFIEMFGDAKDKKIIYIKRDIKDVIISSYFYFVNSYKLRNDLYGYIMHFCHHGNAQFDTWKNHVKEWEKNNNNFTTYEKLKNDVMKELRNILIKLQLSENVNDDIKHAVENELFKKRKKEENFFLRKGIVGDYKNYMDKEMINYINEEMEK